MARLLGIRIRNYKSLADLGLGQVEYALGDALPRFACFIGPNGSGKSTLLDAFGFVADCLLEGVEAACDKPHRGGFERLRTQGCQGPISFELFFDSEDKSAPIVYTIEIDLVEGVPVVIKEWLRQRRKGETRGKPYHFLKLEHGEGKVWKGAYVEGAKDDAQAERIKLDDLNRLGLATLGNLASHPRIVRLRNYIEQWYLSYFIPNAARVLPPAGAQPRLDSHGANVANVLQYLKRTYPKQFENIKDRVAKGIPGLKRIEPEESRDRRLLLRFDEDGYADPFYQQSMSDGTLKMLAYAVLLNDPAPRPFLGIEEPENGLYVELIEALARQFVGHTAARKAKTQIFVTTHSPYFVDALEPDQVWIMRKLRGRATAKRVADLGVVKELKSRGLPLGAQWYANHFTDTPRLPKGRP
ncbi:MAG: AAA family ATPase [Planctomycetes bacterium]|nr:AAA family ATPase [Planctomycetota bacterium]